MIDVLLYVAAATAAVYLLRRAWIRLRLSRAKHPSLRGHAKMALRVAKFLPYWSYDEKRFFRADEAPDEVAERRRAAFDRLAAGFRERAPKTIAASAALEPGVSDMQFTSAYRVPFPFRELVMRRMKVGSVMDWSAGTRLTDLDGNAYYDLTGAYGCNVFGYDLAKEWIREGVRRAEPLGPVLGPYHPVLADNVQRLREISGLDEVSFHMSGTEAVMQAVRLARYHTRRSHVVRFCGAYHGWWDGVQAGVGNPRPAHEVYTLKDMDDLALQVIATRKDIACVLVNPLQALHPNGNAPSDNQLVGSARSASYDRERYTAWLRRLREVCTAAGVPLIFDEVFLGFRLALRGAQEYFGVDADIVTYGKTLGGGLPVGVVCGKSHLMKRFRDDAPADICFARGTFNSHPYVMCAMNEFLQHLDRPEVQAAYRDVDAQWNQRTADLNAALAARELPVRMVNMVSVMTTLYTEPSRYNWMLQYYLRSEGLVLPWIGTGRFIFSHDYTDADFQAVTERIVAAAERMRDDGWWWRSAELDAKWIRKRMTREMLAAWRNRRSA